VPLRELDELGEELVQGLELEESKGLGSMEQLSLVY
jgi:hypothetical protein